MKAKSRIHQNPEEIQAGSIEAVNASLLDSNKTLKSIDQTLKRPIATVTGLQSLNDKQRETNQKLGEIKSAEIETNRTLRKIAEKEYPREMEVSLRGISVITLKGDKGDKGEKGDRGEKGESIVGPQGPMGPEGKRGADGKNGKDGKNVDETRIIRSVLARIPEPKDGKDGVNGKDGSPDTPDEVVEKVNKAKKKIDWKQIKGVPDFSKADTMNQSGYASGGANQMVIQNNGVRLSEYVTTLNFGPGLTASYSNGTILVTANTSGSVLTATGTVDDTNTEFVFTQQPSLLCVNGLNYRSSGDNLTWTWNANTLTATLSIPVGTSGSIFGLI